MLGLARGISMPASAETARRHTRLLLHRPNHQGFSPGHGGNTGCHPLAQRENFQAVQAMIWEQLMYLALGGAGVVMGMKTVDILWGRWY